jgi:hypothetical protein
MEATQKSERKKIMVVVLSLGKKQMSFARWKAFWRLVFTAM